MNRRYRVQWVETHDVEVEAIDEETAIELAMDQTNDVESRKNQSIQYCTEQEQEREFDEAS